MKNKLHDNFLRLVFFWWGVWNSTVALSSMCGRNNTTLFIKTTVETYRSNILSRRAVLRITLSHVTCCICFHITSVPRYNYSQVVGRSWSFMHISVGSAWISSHLGPWTRNCCLQVFQFGCFTDRLRAMGSMMAPSLEWRGILEHTQRFETFKSLM